MENHDPARGGAEPLADRFLRAAHYFQLRVRHPEVPAKLLHHYVVDDEGLPLGEFVCAHTVGHRWNYTGSAYGGEDESYRGEGRCYCARCGADGDA